MRTQLTSLSLAGFKSIRQWDDFRPGNLTILIGSNGAGKSNLISFFRMLSYVMSSPTGLQTHLVQTGKAHSWLHDGQGVTSDIRASLQVETERGMNDYQFGLEYAAGDRLFFNHERFRFLPNGVKPDAIISLGAGHEESKLRERAEMANRRHRRSATCSAGSSSTSSTTRPSPPGCGKPGTRPNRGGSRRTEETSAPSSTG